MRLAIVSDVHGNAFALDAVLNDLRAESPDAVYNLGDTVWGGVDPGRAWDLQAEFAPPSVRGNTDERVSGQRAGKERMRQWVLAQLPPDAAGQLAALPTFSDVAGGELRLAHGSPRDPWEALMLSGTGKGEQMRPATFPELRERLGDFAGKVCIVGHTHREMLSVVGGTTVVNAGPVSRQKDGLPLARWVLLTQTSGRWNVEFRRVAYDVAAATAWVRQHAPASLAQQEIPWLEAGREP